MKLIKLNLINLINIYIMAVQAVIFNKKDYTPTQCNKWLRIHRLRPIKAMHETENYYRYRISEPNPKANYMTKTVGKGIKVIIKSA